MPGFELLTRRKQGFGFETYVRLGFKSELADTLSLAP